MYSPLKVYLRTQYPEGHEHRPIVGHFFMVQPSDAKKLAKFTIECVRLNGGDCFIESEILRIGPMENHPDTIANHQRVINAVFRNNPRERLKQVEELWKTINK